MPESNDPEQALEQGYMGAVPDQIENEAYAVDADHASTAQRVLDQRETLRADAIKNSRDPDAGKSRSKTKAKASSSSSSSSS